MARQSRVALAAAITAAALTWAALLVVAPAWRAAGQFPRAAVASLVYAVADRVCHQLPGRSFARGGVPMPVCARCAGLYGSGAAGALVALLWSLPARGRGRDDLHLLRVVFVASALPTALTWGLEITRLHVPTMEVRALCAVPLGAVTGWVTVRAASGWLR